jgi:hypothetical protein
MNTSITVCIQSSGWYFHEITITKVGQKEIAPLLQGMSWLKQTGIFFFIFKTGKADLFQATGEENKG